MKKEEEKKTPPVAFPEGYDYINEIIAPSLQRSDEINRQLAEYSKASQAPAKPYTLELRPPGTVGNRPSTNWAYRMEKLTEEKSQVEANMTRQVDWQMQMTSADEATKAQVREAMDRRLYPNPYEGMSEKEAHKAGKQPKDPEQSQDWMRDRLVRFRNPSSKEKEENPLDDSQKIMLGQMESVRKKEAGEKPKESSTMSMSARFSQGLSYSQASATENPGTPSPKKGKEDPSPGKN